MYIKHISNSHFLIFCHCIKDLTWRCVIFYPYLKYTKFIEKNSNVVKSQFTVQKSKPITKYRYSAKMFLRETLVILVLKMQIQYYVYSERQKE